MRISHLNIRFFEASIQVFCPFLKLSSFLFAGILPKSCIILYPTYLNVFSQTSACLFTFLMPFDKQHFLILMKFNWSIFPIAVNVYLSHLKKNLSYHEDILMFSSRGFSFHVTLLSTITYLLSQPSQICHIQVCATWQHKLNSLSLLLCVLLFKKTNKSLLVNDDDGNVLSFGKVRRLLAELPELSLQFLITRPQL